MLSDEVRQTFDFLTEQGAFTAETLTYNDVADALLACKSSHPNCRQLDAVNWLLDRRDAAGLDA